MRELSAQSRVAGDLASPRRPGARRACGAAETVSLTGPDFWSVRAGSVMPVGAGQICFFCEGRIRREPAWTWNGATGQIWLHVGCAADFGLRLSADLLAWQQKAQRRFHELDRRGPGL